MISPAEREARRLREALREVARTLEDPASGANDVIWYDDATTLLEFVKAALEYNPDQVSLPFPFTS